MNGNSTNKPERRPTPLELELERLQSIVAGLSDPAKVWVNILRGTIARPAALDHYEELKAQVESLSAEVGRFRGVLTRLASMEAFDVSRFIDPARDKELIARIKYAETALGAAPASSRLSPTEARSDES